LVVKKKKIKQTNKIKNKQTNFRFFYVRRNQIHKFQISPVICIQKERNKHP
jgi:hypothetical protein